MDFDWIRPRLSLLYGSGDDDPFDDRGHGLRCDLREPAVRRRRHELLDPPGRAADRRRPRRAVEPQRRAREPALVEGGGAVELHQPGHPARRARRRHGRAADAARFAERELRCTSTTPTVVEVARNQGAIDKHIGYDVSAALTWRPMMSQNIVRARLVRDAAGGRRVRRAVPGRRPGLLPAERDLQLLRQATMKTNTTSRICGCRLWWAAARACVL